MTLAPDTFVEHEEQAARFDTSVGTLDRLKAWLQGPTSTVYLVLIMAFAWLVYLDSSYLEPRVTLVFLLKGSVALLFVAIGQLFVVVGGGFDLSVGGLVTFNGAMAAILIDGEPDRIWWVMLLMMLVGIGVGLFNGLVTVYARVPSFVTTLGALLVLEGAARYITDGAPRGDLPDEYRKFGRAQFDDVPIVDQLPYAIVALIPAALLAWWLLHRTRFGHQVFAIGANDRAALFAGVPVGRIRVATFVLSGLFAAAGSILLSGFIGVAPNIGDGLEFEAIAAVVLGGAVLGGGTGSVPAAIAGATTLTVVFTVLNQLGYERPVRLTVQGVILIGAVAITELRQRRRRR